MATKAVQKAQNAVWTQESRDLQGAQESFVISQALYNKIPLSYECSMMECSNAFFYSQKR